jgi:peptide/nickel transport system permease protein
MRAVVRRLCLFIGALFGMSLIIFAALRILPGDVASVMAGVNASPQRVAALRGATRFEPVCNRAVRRLA